MKKIRLFVCFILSIVLFNNIDVLASTRVNIRTESDYLVPSDVIVDDSNRNAILNTPAVDATEKVYDFAEVLSATEEKQLYNKINEFIKETSIDLVVLTIKDNPIDNTGNYAHNFYNYNNFMDDGILLLIDFEMSGVYMVIEGQGHSLFPDSRIEPILSQVYTKVMSKDFYGACTFFVNSVRGFVNLGEAEEGEDIVFDEDGSVHKESKVLQALIFACIGTVAIIFFLISLNKTVRPDVTARNYLNKDTVLIDGLSEKLIDTKTIKVGK